MIPARGGDMLGPFGLSANLFVLALAVQSAWAQPLSTSSGQTYPSRAIKIVVAFPAGGGADLAARVTGQRLSESFGQPVVVENRVGANGNIGAEAVARSAPDGYTLVMGSNANITTNPHLMALGYDPMKDLAPVAMLTVNPLLLFVNPSVVPVASFKEFLAYVKAQDGKADYASAGNGSPAHLSGELLKLTAGIRMVHVPYKGGPPGVNDVLGGRVGSCSPPRRPCCPTSARVNCALSPRPARGARRTLRRSRR